uniref:Uncharacterized protein n=1 Tax=Myoviridae sp. ctCo31 TaxID=2825053 RepID=A0A8S5UML7_9CAUD|nr:MAG TPA: hypothetical protein [Myoviridae sp. ctCo31]
MLEFLIVYLFDIIRLPYNYSVFLNIYSDFLLNFIDASRTP